MDGETVKYVRSVTRLSSSFQEINFEDRPKKVLFRHSTVKHSKASKVGDVMTKQNSC